MLAHRAVASVALALIMGIASTAAASAANDVAQFYGGKRIRIIAGAGVGGGYDTYARMLGRHLADHIPGHPTVTVEDMPGAGGIVAANFLANAAVKDGTVIGALQRETALVQIMGAKGTKFRAETLNWLGSLANEAGVCAVATRTGIKSFADVFAHTYALGGTGANTTEYFPALFNNLLGAKFKMVKGYPSTSNIHLALERGELDGVCQSWSSFKELGRAMIAKGAIKPMVQVALRPDPEMAKQNVPMLDTFIAPGHLAPGRTADDVKTFFRLILTPESMGRPFALAPDVPAARVKALRAAFVATAKDPKFLAEATKMRRDIDLVTGEEIQGMVGEMAATPKAKLDELQDLLKFKGPTSEVNISLVHETGTVVKSEHGGRQVVIDAKGKNHAAKVSGSKTKVMIDGKKAKRGAVMAGMTCTVAYYGPGTEAKELSCKN